MVLLGGLAHKKAMLGNNTNEDDIELKECVYFCVSVRGLTLTVRMNEMPVYVCVRMHAFHVSE